MTLDEMIQGICTVRSATGCVNCTFYDLCKNSDKYVEQIKACYRGWMTENEI